MLLTVNDQSMHCISGRIALSGIMTLTRFALSGIMTLTRFASTHT